MNQDEIENSCSWKMLHYRRSSWRQLARRNAYDGS